jgi:hypothetical protein
MIGIVKVHKFHTTHSSWCFQLLTSLSGQNISMLNPPTPKCNCAFKPGIMKVSNMNALTPIFEPLLQTAVALG